MSLEIKAVIGSDNPVFHDARELRQAVFVTEQGIDPALEFDENDAVVKHVVGYQSGRPVTTVRVDARTPYKMKLQRVATLPTVRGQGLASQVLQYVLKAVPKGTDVTLDAQEFAVGLYERLGFKVVGEVFMEVGIPHYHMVWEP